MTLEKIDQCPICSGNSFQTFLNCKDYTTSNEIFSLDQCNSCQFVFTNPRPGVSEIGHYYKSDTYISHTGNSKKLIDKIYLAVRSYSLRAKRKIVESYTTKGKLLDYGCGTGEFANECQLNGWKIEAIEPSDDARQKASKLTNSKIHSEISQVIDNQFDTITMWHVLEHVHQLNETLQRLSQLIKPNGTIFIAVPNHLSADAMKYEKYWAAYDVPRHLWHFSKDNMKQLVTKHNLKIKEILPMKFDSYYVSLLSEQYKNPTQNSIARYVKAFISGFLSNRKANNKKNHSSLIYVIQK